MGDLIDLELGKNGGAFISIARIDIGHDGSFGTNGLQNLIYHGAWQKAAWGDAYGKSCRNLSGDAISPR